MKLNKVVRNIIIGIISIYVISAIACSGTGASKERNDSYKDIETDKKEVVDENLVDVELSDGNYISGIDFKQGVYDVIAIEGTGNISSSNMFSGGINEVFGIGDEFYIKESKNIELPADVKLTIKGGLKIKLVPSHKK